ncbi:MAG: ATP-binding protein [Bacteroidota bacterium]
MKYLIAFCLLMIGLNAFSQKPDLELLKDSLEKVNRRIDSLKVGNQYYSQDTIYKEILRSIDLAEQIGDTASMLWSKYFLTHTIFSQDSKNRRKSLRQLFQLIQSYPHPLKQEYAKVLAHAYNKYSFPDFGIPFHLQDLFPIDSSIVYIEKSIALFPLAKDTFLQMLNYKELMEKDLRRNDYANCLEHGRETIRLAAHTPPIWIKVQNHIFFVECLIENGMLEEARKQLNIIEQYKEQAEAGEAYKLLQNLGKNVAAQYAKIEEHEKAYEYQTYHTEYLESEFHQQRQGELQRLNLAYETQEKENEILRLDLENQKAQKERTQLIWGIVISLLLAIFLIIFFQIRQRYLAREALQFKEINQFKSRLYTNITHEFRTPLTVILGMAKEIRANDQPKQMIQRNAQKLLDLVNQLLDLNKLEAKAFELKQVQGDVISSLKGIVQSFQALADTKHIQLSFHCGMRSLIMDHDPEKLGQIVSNLLSNAIKFTPESGQIDLYAHTEDQHLLVSIVDNGIGIPEQDLPFLFDHFFQASSNAPNVGGTGIGLALAKELAELAGGSLEVQSRQGEGSTFLVSLPISRHAPKQEISTIPFATADSIKLSQSSGFDSGKPNNDDSLPLALIVEDDQDIADYLQLCLQDQYRLLYAKDGQEGIEQAKKYVPDIIISDVMMPKMDGFALCYTLKEDERTSHIPIILLTAKATQKAKLEGLQHGADAYLSKPFDRKELEIRLKKLIELRQVFLKKYSLSNEEVKMPDHPREEAFLQKVRQVIIERLADEGFDVRQLSEEVHLSRMQVHRKLKALTGLSASLYIRQIRLRHAHQLLRRSDLTVSEIAYQVGFKNPSYFSRVFAEEYGHSPSEIR